MDAGSLASAEPVITARLLLGSCVWVSRWYRPKDNYSPEEITEVAVDLVRGLQTPAKPGASKRTAARKKKV